MKKDNWIIRVFKNPWYIAMAVAAFISVVSFFQINSAWADANNFNTWWTVIGVVFGVATIFFGYKANKTSTGMGG